MEQQIQNRISKKNKKNQAYNLIQLSDIQTENSLEPNQKLINIRG